MKQKKSKNQLGILIPLYKNAPHHLLESLSQQENKEFKVYIISNSNLIDWVLNPDDYDFDVELISTNQEYYHLMVNEGVKKINEPYFSVLQAEDVCYPHYTKNAFEHINTFDDYDAFLHIIAEADKDGRVLSLRNQSAWGMGYTKNQGKLDLESVKEGDYYSLSGAVIKTESFIEAGMFKHNFNIMYYYEFLLRFLQKGYEVYVIGRLHMQHNNLIKHSFDEQLAAEFSDPNVRREIYQEAKRLYIFDDPKKELNVAIQKIN
jgi:GT2 family glycosyltransferase